MDPRRGTNPLEPDQRREAHPPSRASGHAPALPLDGLRVLEMHAVGPVPHAGWVLQRLGATVTRITPPSPPDLGMNLEPRFDTLNHGKRVHALDLKNPGGRDELLRALDSSDVLIEGFRPGVLERLDLAPSLLLQRNARIVVGRLSGFGARGPLMARAGHDINYLALSGILHAIGTKDMPLPPVNVVADFGGGAMSLVAGVLAALVRRGIDGRGSEVRTSITAGTIALTPMFHGMVDGGVWSLQRMDNVLDGAPPFYRCYRCSDGRHVAVGPLEPRFYRQLLVLLGLEDEIDAAAQYDRGTWPATATRIAERFAREPRDTWANRARDTDACVSPVLDFVESRSHEQAAANRWFAPPDHTSSRDPASTEPIGAGPGDWIEFIR